MMELKRLIEQGSECRMDKMQNSSDYYIHKLVDKSQIYTNERKLWWSSELKRWMCTSPELIKIILDDPDFRVLSYSVEKITEGLSLNLDHVTRLLKCIPLAQEGELHKALRKRHAAAIAAKSEEALDDFKKMFESKLAELIAKKHQPIDLFSDLLRPCIHQFFSTLAEINYSQLAGSDSMSQIFDETLSLSKRIAINKKIGDIVKYLSEDLSEDEKYFRVSIAALGTDSLLGTLSGSLVSVLTRHPDDALSKIVWDDEIPATGVPVIERMLCKEKEINGIAMLAGQRVRLYLDAAGYAHSEVPFYSRLYFGSGAHLCLGMPVGRKIWKLMKSILEKIDKKMKIHEVGYRNNDNVFNIYDKIRVTIHD